MMHAMDQGDIDGAIDDARERHRAMDDARDGLERQHAMDQADIDGAMDDARERHIPSDG